LDSGASALVPNNMSGISFLEMKISSNGVFLEDDLREFKMTKNTTKEYHEVILAINQREVVVTFWSKDRVDYLMNKFSKKMSKHLKELKIKRFILSYADAEIEEKSLKQGYQIIRSMSSSLSLDMCYRKFKFVEKKMSEFNIVQVKSQEDEVRKNKAEPVRKNSQQTDNLISDELSVDSKDEKVGKKILESAPKLQEQTANARSRSHNRTSIDSSFSSGDDKDKKKVSEFSLMGSIDTPGLKDRKTGLSSLDKMMERSAEEEEEKHFEYVYDLLGYYFGIEDKITTGFNVGMIKKDLNMPVDSIILIGEKALYIHTNYMIKYETDSKTVVNLVAKPNLRNKHLGKWYMDQIQMTTPFKEDIKMVNSFKVNKEENINQLIEIPFAELTEVYSKHYIGRFPTALELWTIKRSPFFLVFNRGDRAAAWSLLFSRWIKLVEPSKPIKEQQKKINFDRVFFCIKTEVLNEEDSQVGLKGTSIVKVYEEDHMITKFRRVWVDGVVDNFTYLMLLNSMAGRSLKFYSSYFVFPHVIKNFSEFMNKKEESMRNLSLPIGLYGHTKENLEMKYSANTYEQFHYGVFFSHKNSTEYYLLRTMPYTQHHYDFHLGKMDSFDRMFKRFDKNFEICARDCFGEMIPENYYFEHYLVNMNNFKFYEKEDLNNVEMPAWSSQNPRYFTINMRKALESESVQKNLHKWIDLIFGSAQNDKEAVKRYNTYRSTHYLYANEIVKESIPKKTYPIFAEIYQMGQMPGKLMSQNHPQRNVLIDFKRFSILYNLKIKYSEIQELPSFPKVFMNQIEDLKVNIDPKRREFNRMKIIEQHSKPFGPIRHILTKIKNQ
jgi:hypothetical protein